MSSPGHGALEVQAFCFNNEGVPSSESLAVFSRLVYGLLIRAVQRQAGGPTLVGRTHIITGR